MRKFKIFSFVFLIILFISTVVYYNYKNLNVDWQDDYLEYDFEYKSKLDRTLENMTLEEKVSQLFIGSFYTDSTNKIEQYQLGGYIMFDYDFENKTKEEVINNINNYQEVSKIPLFIAVDEEGGIVNRVSDFFRTEPFKSSQELYKQGGLDLIKSDTIEKSNFLKEFGINMNLAPVADVSVNRYDYIYERTFGQNAVNTSEYVSLVVETMKEQNMISVLKHFPGYGNNKDSHSDIVYDYRYCSHIQNNDLLPFISGIEKETPMVLLSHNIVKCMSEKPSSLSSEVVNLLRNDLKFKGIIITDDLAMNGIKNYTDEASVLAIQAGVDMIISTDFENDYNKLLNAVNSGIISEERIDESVRKILELKIEYGLF